MPIRYTHYDLILKLEFNEGPNRIDLMLVSGERSGGHRRCSSWKVSTTAITFERPPQDHSNKFLYQSSLTRHDPVTQPYCQVEEAFARLDYSRDVRIMREGCMQGVIL